MPHHPLEVTWARLLERFHGSPFLKRLLVEQLLGPRHLRRQITARMTKPGNASPLPWWKKSPGLPAPSADSGKCTYPSLSHRQFANVPNLQHGHSSIPRGPSSVGTPWRGWKEWPSFPHPTVVTRSPLPHSLMNKGKIISISYKVLCKCHSVTFAALSPSGSIGNLQTSSRGTSYRKFWHPCLQEFPPSPPPQRRFSGVHPTWVIVSTSFRFGWTHVSPYRFELEPSSTHNQMSCHSSTGHFLSRKAAASQTHSFPCSFQAELSNKKNFMIIENWKTVNI